MVYFLIPVFNEAPNIQELSKNLQNVLPDLIKHYVFVDDCSTDNTAELIEQSFPLGSFSLLHNAKNSGPGYSFNNGLEYILNKSEAADDIIVTLEGDNTSDLSILPLMNALATTWNYDLVLSSVYAQGGGFSQTSFFRKVISLLANQILRFGFDIKVLTLSSFYRVYKVSLLRRVKARNQRLIVEPGFICALELLIKCIRENAKIIEVPMVLKSDKRKGKSKMKVFKTSLDYINFLSRSIFR